MVQMYVHKAVYNWFKEHTIAVRTYYKSHTLDNISLITCRLKTFDIRITNHTYSNAKSI